MLHRIVERMDCLLGAVGAIPLLVPAADDGELVQDVRHCIARPLQRHAIHEHPSPLIGNEELRPNNVTG
ncbi:MAG: hypothetical protein KatS3mg039_1611 [Candidatus Kapaibacterium sp.]|nr:MAG: hypothetical protein KatS3mg039_1611 [Candidatus Kapabacteria bacterium]